MDKNDLQAILYTAITISLITTMGIVCITFILCLFHTGNPILIGGIAALVFFGALISKGLK